ncbi:MAG: hypothetical protein WCF69_12160 [Mycobacterium sp.]
MTSLITEASSFMAFTQPQILFCGASPDAARRTSPIPIATLLLIDDKFRDKAAAQVSIGPTAEAAGLLVVS